MWVSKSLDRARRRFRAEVEPAAAAPPLSEAGARPPATTDGVATPSVEADAVDVLVVSLVRPELDRLMTGLTRSLDPHMPKPDSPALLAGALTTAIRRVGGTGKPAVTRSPAGLYTPEYWHIRVEGADGRTRDAIGRLTAGGRV